MFKIKHLIGAFPSSWYFNAHTPISSLPFYLLSLHPFSAQPFSFPFCVNLTLLLPFPVSHLLFCFAPHLLRLLTSLHRFWFSHPTFTDCSGEVWSNTKVGNKQCSSDTWSNSASMDWSAFESGQAETPLAWPSCTFVSVYKCLKIILLDISLNSSAKRIAMILASMFSLTLYYPNI